MPARTLKYIFWSKYFYQDVTVVYDFETMFEKLEEAELKLEKKKRINDILKKPTCMCQQPLHWLFINRKKFWLKKSKKDCMDVFPEKKKFYTNLQILQNKKWLQEKTKQNIGQRKFATYVKMNLLRMIKIILKAETFILNQLDVMRKQVINACMIMMNQKNAFILNLDFTIT